MRCVHVPFVLAPGDASWLRDGFDGRGVIAIEVVPSPAEERVSFAVCSASNIACTPSQAANATGPSTWCRCFPTSATAAFRPIIAMMPLSLYANGLVGSPPNSRRMFCAAHRPDCCATDPSCGKGTLSSSPEGMFATSPTAYTPGKPLTFKSGRTSRRPPRPGTGPAAWAMIEADSTAAPDNRPGRDLAAIGELDVVGMNGGDAGLELDIGAGLGQLAHGIVVSLARELAKQCRPTVDDGDTARLAELPSAGQRMHQLGERPGGLDSGRATADHHYIDHSRLGRALNGHGLPQQSLQVPT